MIIDKSTEANRILDEQRARRAGWLRASARRAPSWFAGGELDRLTPSERDALFNEVAPRNKPAWFVLVILFGINLPRMIAAIESGRGRVLWIAVAFGYVLIAVGAWLARRHVIRVSARRRVRESAEWPLLAQRRLP